MANVRVEGSAGDHDAEVREGRQLARETKRFAVEQTRRSWMNFAVSLIAAAGALAVVFLKGPWYYRVPVTLVLALLEVRWFVLYHDHLHGAFLRDSRIARVFFKAFGLVTLSPSGVWTETHGHHHLNNCRKLGLDSIGTYPVLSTQEYRTSDRATRFVYIVSRHPLTIALGYFTVFLWGFCIRPLLYKPRQNFDALASLAVHGAVIAVLAVFRPDVLFLGFLMPLIIAMGFGSYLFYAQHNFPEVKLRSGKNWDHVSAALRSSSYFRMGPVMSWFTGNIGYHHAHHLNARIPFYRLPEVMAACEGLQSPGTTTFRPKDILRCLRLKLWDPERDCMVSFAEARSGASGSA